MFREFVRHGGSLRTLACAMVALGLAHGTSWGQSRLFFVSGHVGEREHDWDVVPTRILSLQEGGAFREVHLFNDQGANSLALDHERKILVVGFPRIVAEQYAVLDFRRSPFQEFRRALPPQTFGRPIFFSTISGEKWQYVVRQVDRETTEGYYAALRLEGTPRELRLERVPDSGCRAPLVMAELSGRNSSEIGAGSVGPDGMVRCRAGRDVTVAVEGLPPIPKELWPARFRERNPPVEMEAHIDANTSGFTIVQWMNGNDDPLNRPWRVVLDKKENRWKVLEIPERGWMPRVFPPWIVYQRQPGWSTLQARAANAESETAPPAIPEGFPTQLIHPIDGRVITVFPECTDCEILLVDGDQIYARDQKTLYRINLYDPTQRERLAHGDEVRHIHWAFVTDK